MTSAEPTGPAAGELSDVDVARIAAAQDAARMALDEITARDPSVKAVRNTLDERRGATEAVTGAYRLAGVSQRRAEVAATCWLLERRDPRYCLAAADEQLDGER